MYTIYCLTVNDGRKYIGATSTALSVRFNNGNGYRFLPNLWEIIKGDGWDSISKEVLADGLSQTEASAAETYFISLYDTTNPRKGFNREVGGIFDKKKVSNETRARIAAASSGEQNHNYGKHFSYEHRRRISESNFGKKRSSETCRNIGKAKKKAVIQLTTRREIVAVWESGKAASLATGVQAGHISKVCKHKRSTAGGFIWAYAD